MGRFFHIEDVDSDKLLVIILSCELTSVYWNELLETFRENHWRRKTVYFDFLYRNGYENRFFSALLDDNSKLQGRLHRCELERSIDMRSRRFFAQHSELLSDSILSSLQVERYLDEVFG